MRSFAALTAVAAVLAAGCQTLPSGTAPRSARPADAQASELVQGQAVRQQAQAVAGEQTGEIVVSIGSVAAAERSVQMHPVVIPVPPKTAKDIAQYQITVATYGDCDEPVPVPLPVPVQEASDSARGGIIAPPPPPPCLPGIAQTFWLEKKSAGQQDYFTLSNLPVGLARLTVAAFDRSKNNITKGRQAGTKVVVVPNRRVQATVELYLLDGIGNEPHTGSVGTTINIHDGKWVNVHDNPIRLEPSRPPVEEPTEPVSRQ